MGKTISISGKVVYKDGTPVSGARIKIWDVDTNPGNKNDLIVNDTTSSNGRFSGSGRWHDAWGDIGLYKYEVTHDGKTKKGSNITNPLNFFDELNTKWLSPAQQRISIDGTLLYKNGDPIKNARIQVWEMDNLQRDNADDLIVNDTTDSIGKFSGSGAGKDSGGVQLFRYKVTHPKTGEVLERKNKTKADLNRIKTNWRSDEQIEITLDGVVVYKDGSPVKGAKIKIWETDKMQPNNPDDLIVNDTTDNRGRYSGTGRGKDSGGIQLFRFTLTMPDGEVIERHNKTDIDLKTINTRRLSPEQQKITITGKLVYRDGSPVEGARIQVWETDKMKPNNADDLIVNDRTDKKGRFSGTGIGKDTKEIASLFRYKIVMPDTGDVIERHNKTKADLNKINTHKLSEEERTLKGRVMWSNRSPAAGVRIRIWETDNFRPNDPDDLIVDMVTDKNGYYSGTGDWRDDPVFNQIQTFRWEVSIPKLNYKEESKIKELPRQELEYIRLKENIPGWQNWIDDLGTLIENDFSFRPSTDSELRNNLEKALNHDKKIRVVGSGHSHSQVAKPYDYSAMIDLSRLSGELGLYSWLKDDVRNQLGRGSIHGEPSVVKDYVRVKSGTALRTLYREILAKKDEPLGLLNMGPFDGQRIGGLINTNTHGTGINLPGFSDMVRSMEMFVIVPTSDGTNAVELWVIEPSDGISDPEKFRERADDRHLVQNDDVFYSAVCGYGLFGVAYSYTLAVRDHYWMSEDHHPMTWGKLKKLLRNLSENNIPDELSGTYKFDGDEDDERFKQVKIYINTAECIDKGGLKDSVRVRLDTWMSRPWVPKPHNYERLNIHPIWPPMRKRNEQNLIQKVVESLMDPEDLKKQPSDTTLYILQKFFFEDSKTTEFMHKYHESAYYRAIRRGRDNTLEYNKSIPEEDARIDNTSFNADPIPQDYGPSIEVCIPLDQTLNAIESMMNKIAKLGVKFLGPVGVRFTAKSKHYLSPTQGRDSAFIELAGLLPSRGPRDLNPAHADENSGFLDPNNDEFITKQRRLWPEFMAIYNKAMFQLFNELSSEIPGIRFHKGKLNQYNPRLLKKHYPDTYDKFLDMYHLFSSSGMLDSPNSVEQWKLAGTRPRISEARLGQRLERLKTV